MSPWSRPLNADPVTLPPTPLKRTPLYALNMALGGRMVPFAGYEMPVQFASGVLKEHHHVRRACGLFDVSHMGQIVIRARSGRFEDAALALERLVPVDILGLAPHRQRYAFFTNAAGGMRDDLMVANRTDHLLLIVNAACKVADAAHLTAHLSHDCEIEVADRALLALQGPKAVAALATLAPDCAALRFQDICELTLLGARCVISRSGYTGEDGFEVSIPRDQAEAIAQALLALPEVLPIGLGARDSLRLEAGLCLYGSDIDATTTPIEAGLSWAIQAARRSAGLRPGGYPGADIILAQLNAAPARRRVGLRGDSRAPVRGGAPLFADAQGGLPIGVVTSGGFGPTVDAPVAMGYVPTALATPGTRLFAEVRGQRLALAVAPLPFVPHTYKRG